MQGVFNPITILEVFEIMRYLAMSEFKTLFYELRKVSWGLHLYLISSLTPSQKTGLCTTVIESTI
jgi:hypothetical protein